ncbi:MAG: hypothetical protein HY814_13815 [Candidatus Riflebacteria bacterium]|nr:hypothetical protein [Candidatus Riflebacteria bacterium]
MVRTLTVTAQIPVDRKLQLQLQLPDDVPEGPAEIALVVITPQADVKPAAEAHAWARYCIENTLELERTDFSSHIEDFTGRRF